MDTGFRVEGGFGYDRAFKHPLRLGDLTQVEESSRILWGSKVTVIDPMAGGGSIPLEAARLGFHSLANEYNPVACSVLEATVDYPFRFGQALGEKARKWAKIWGERAQARLDEFYPKKRLALVHAYIFARTVSCPDTPGHPHTPLVPDWHLVKPSNHSECGRNCTFGVPVVDKKKGLWHVEIRQGGSGVGRLSRAPKPTYSDGKGISLFTDLQIPSDYIKAKAQAGEIKSALYAVAIKTNKGLEFRPPEPEDLKALVEAQKELVKLRPGWEKANVIPTELYPEISSDERPRLYGMPRWADMFSPRQLLAMGVLVEELRKLRTEIIKAEGRELGEAVAHLLAFGINKFANWNALLASWNAPFGTARSVFDRHDFAFKATFCEMAPCGSGVGLQWASNNVIEAYEDLSKLPRHESAKPAEIFLGSATNLPQIPDRSITAVVVDPPYADNVQYSELADFFYVWLKRTQGHRRPEWFSTYLCEHDLEAVVNISRHRDANKPVKEARKEAHKFYQGLMRDSFQESKRILRDDGVLTVMFTHKKQEAWEALFTSLISSGFTVTATWPVKTESEHALNQAKKNAAQSTVILVARKRSGHAGVGYFDSAMQEEIRRKARAAAERLQHEGLNPVDQLVGSFGPAMEVYSRYDEVRTDTGEPVGVDKAIDEASNAVSQWRIDQLAARGLGDVEAEGRFTLLCWDVLGAVEFRFNEAKLLGNAVGMDVDQLVTAGLVTKSGDKIKILPAKDRRRERALEPDEMNETLFGSVTVPKKRTKKQTLKIHPNDPQFRTALDACHALALRHLEAKGGAAGIGAAKALVRQQNWNKDSAVARLVQALVKAAPEAVRHEKGKKSVAALFPEFRAWHAMLDPIFGITPPDWTEKAPPQGMLALEMPTAEEPEDEESEEADNGEE
jgi:adenine-specific DNA methylase